MPFPEAVAAVGASTGIAAAVRGATFLELLLWPVSWGVTGARDPVLPRGKTMGGGGEGVPG